MRARWSLSQCMTRRARALAAGPDTQTPSRPRAGSAPRAGSCHPERCQRLSHTREQRTLDTTNGALDGQRGSIESQMVERNTMRHGERLGRRRIPDGARHEETLCDVRALQYRAPNQPHQPKAAVQRTSRHRLHFQLHRNRNVGKQNKRKHAQWGAEGTMTTP